MGNIWIREFTGGLDTRRMPETTPGGALIVGKDGHITRGGDFEKRKAFVKLRNLPADTVGLARDRKGLVTFRAREVAKADLDESLGPAAPLDPQGGPALGDLIRVQKLPVLKNQKVAYVTAFDMFAGKIYAAVEFKDGDREHYYNGAQVQSWVDQKARVTFKITEATLPKRATGTFTIMDSDEHDKTNDLKLNGVSIIKVENGPWEGIKQGEELAEILKTQINKFKSDPDYTATRDEKVVTVTAVDFGDDIEGKTFNLNATSGVSWRSTSMTGGTKATVMRDVTVGGESVMKGRVEFDGNLKRFMRAIVKAINAKGGEKERNFRAVYDEDDGITIIAMTPGVEPNGMAIEFDVENAFKTKPEAPEMAKGAGGELYKPGPFVKTVKDKEYATAGSNLYFSGIARPKNWNPDTLGAGFIDMSSQDGEAGELTALAKYQTYLAVFAERCILIWYMDPDPALNRLSQVLNNTGTRFPQSVTQFGDQDLFYLDETGIRSLRARDSSSAAATTDIGVLIDPLVAPVAKSITGQGRRQVHGLIEPSEGRFWQILKDRIFVFSFFGGSKVSAWTEYACVDSKGNAFKVDYPVVYNGIVYIRSGNTLYAYGGADGTQYDDTRAIAQIPFLNGEKPTVAKTLRGVDVAAEGVWDIEVMTRPTQPEVSERVATIDRSTFDEQRIAMLGHGTHISIRVTSQGPGPARLGSLVIHYDSEDEKNAD